MKITSRLKKALAENTLLTRYVDLHSFLYFITQNKLRFARLDTFEDLNEGFSIHTAESVKEVTENTRAIKAINGKEKMLEHIANLKQQHNELATKYQELQKNLFACCWYMGNKESVAMWNLYSNRDSVAIRFDARELIDIIHKTAMEDDDNSEMQYGCVEYADLSGIDDLLNKNCIGFLKDDSFMHEQEFRFLTEKIFNDDALEYELHLGDLKKVDFTILSHPKMEEWKIRNILHVLSCYDLSEKFQPSELALKNKF
jgi:hypothetical protein